MVDMAKSAIAHGYEGVDKLVLSTLGYELDSQFLDTVTTGDGAELIISALGSVLSFTPDGEIYSSKNLNGLETAFRKNMIEREATIQKIVQADPNDLQFKPSEWGVESLRPAVVEPELNHQPKGKYLGLTLNGMSRDQITLDDYLGKTVQIDFEFDDGTFQSRQMVGSVSQNSEYADYVCRLRESLNPDYLGRYEEGQFNLICDLNGATVNYSSDTFTSHDAGQISPKVATKHLRKFLFENSDKFDEDAEPARLLFIHTHPSTTPVSYGDIQSACDLEGQMEFPVDVIAVSSQEDVYFLYTSELTLD